MLKLVLMASDTPLLEFLSAHCKVIDISSHLITSSLLHPFLYRPKKKQKKHVTEVKQIIHLIRFNFLIPLCQLCALCYVLLSDRKQSM